MNAPFESCSSGGPLCLEKCGPSICAVVNSSLVQQGQATAVIMRTSNVETTGVQAPTCASRCASCTFGALPGWLH